VEGPTQGHAQPQQPRIPLSPVEENNTVTTSAVYTINPRDRDQYLAQHDRAPYDDDLDYANLVRNQEWLPGARVAFPRHFPAGRSASPTRLDWRCTADEAGGMRDHTEVSNMGKTQPHALLDSCRLTPCSRCRGLCRSRAQLFRLHRALRRLQRPVHQELQDPGARRRGPDVCTGYALLHADADGLCSISCILWRPMASSQHLASPHHLSIVRERQAIAPERCVARSLARRALNRRAERDQPGHRPHRREQRVGELHVSPTRCAAWCCHILPRSCWPVARESCTAWDTACMYIDQLPAGHRSSASYGLPSNLVGMEWISHSHRWSARLRTHPCMLACAAHRCALADYCHGLEF
jgi:hypothetical protein